MRVKYAIDKGTIHQGTCQEGQNVPVAV